MESIHHIAFKYCDVQFVRISSSLQSLVHDILIEKWILFEDSSDRFSTVEPLPMAFWSQKPRDRYVGFTHSLNELGLANPT